MSSLALAHKYKTVDESQIWAFRCQCVSVSHFLYLKWRQELSMDECFYGLSTKSFAQCQYLPEGGFAAKAISRVSSAGIIRIRCMFTLMCRLTLYFMHGWAWRSTHTQVGNTPQQIPSFSTYLMPYSHAVQVPTPPHMSLQRWSALIHSLISTYSMLWNKKVTERSSKLCAWIHLPTSLCNRAYIRRAVISLLTEMRGGVSLQYPLFSRGEGVAQDGFQCTGSHRQSGCSLPGPTEGEI